MGELLHGCKLGCMDYESETGDAKTLRSVLQWDN